MEREENMDCVLCGTPVDPEYGEEVYDGWICEDCAQKLSPWVSDLEMLELEDLEEQLDMREENLELLKDFHPTRSFYLPGMSEKIFLDDENKRFLVTDGFDIRRENPDIISLDEVVDAEVLVDEEREEIGDGLYQYSYNLSMDISLDHPYLEHIDFLLNAEPLVYESEKKPFLGFGGFDPSEEEGYQYVEGFGYDIFEALMGTEEEINHRYDVRPGEFQLGEIPEPEEEPEKTEVPVAGESMVCPWCGSRTRINEDYRCEHCGGNL